MDERSIDRQAPGPFRSSPVASTDCTAGVRLLPTNYGAEGIKYSIGIRRQRPAGDESFPRNRRMTADPSSLALPLEVEFAIDRVCDEFERAWKNGRPSLEAFLAHAAAGCRPHLLLELLGVDLSYRRQTHE